MKNDDLNVISNYVRAMAVIQQKIDELDRESLTGRDKDIFQQDHF